MLVIDAPPVAGNDAATTEDSTIRILPLPNDTDDNPLFVAGIGVPGYGSGVLGECVYRPRYHTTQVVNQIWLDVAAKG